MARANRRGLAALAAALSVMSAAVACRGSGDEARGEAAPVTTAAAVPEPSGLDEAPLTGLPVDDEDIRTRPAVVVKVDNDPKARPQSGLDKADVVVEERVEGSVVRFLAVFHSRDAKLVGPIRSLRPTDPGIVAPIGGVFAYSGGIAAFESQLKKAGVKAVTERNDENAFILRSGRQRPYKTFADTSELRAEASAKAGPPPPLFSRAPDGTSFAEAGSPAVKATVVFGSRTTAVWDYDGVTGRWKRKTNGTLHTVEGGTQLSFTTVILQKVPYKDTGFTDKTAAQVDEAVVVGKGEAIVLSQGRQVKARWTKTSLKAVTTYTNAATGEPLAVPAGTTWVSLVPLDAPITIAATKADAARATSTTAIPSGRRVTTSTTRAR